MLFLCEKGHCSSPYQCAYLHSRAKDNWLCLSIGQVIKKKETLRGYVFESCHVQIPASCSYSYVLKQAIWMALQLEHVHHIHFQQFIIIEDCPCTQMTKSLSEYETVCGTGYAHSRYSVHVKTTMFGAISRLKCLGSAVVVAVR